MHIEIRLQQEDQTRRLAEDIAAIIRTGDTIALQGDLGAGKTTFSRYLLRALADDADLDVPSPTFTLAQSYCADTLGMRLSIQHFDFYRLNSPDEIDEIGFHAALEEGAALVEWPQLAIEHIPQDALWLSLEFDGDDGRVVTLTSDQPERWRDRLERTLAIRRFLSDHQDGFAERRHLTGDASTRAYERIILNGNCQVLMNAPPLPDGPPVRNGLPYSRIAHLAESVRPFVAIGQLLKDHGFSAPTVFAADLDQGLLLLEDLGTETALEDGKPIVARYETAIDLLAALHAEQWPEFAPLADGSSHRIPLYDETAYLIEAELYPDWYVPHITGEDANPAIKTEFIRLWRDLISLLDDSENSLLLRDFHSPNLIWLPERKGVHRIGLIDYQDALIGPTAYDVASLCQDARITIEPSLESALLKRYCAARAATDPNFDANIFLRDYAILATQRATKILGIFARLKHRDGKPNYLRHIPRLNAYLNRCLEHPVLTVLRSWYERNAPEKAS